MNRLLQLLSCLVALLLLSATPGLAQNRFPLGTDLTGPTDWDTEFPFADVFKASRPWISGAQGQFSDGRTLTLDAQGWVSALLSGQYAETVIFSERSNAVAPGGQYNVYYDGEGTLQYLGNAQLVTHATGHDVVNVTQAAGGVFLYITSTNPANYLRNIRMMMPGTVDGDLFNPTFLDRIHTYSTLRFMPWIFATSTSNAPNRWASRTTPSSARWNISWDNVAGHSPGVPVEVMVALANRLNVNPWFSIPYLADDDYTANFAQLVAQTLNANLKAYFEWSNENWNGIYPQATYCQQQGLALNLSADPFTARTLYSALRSRQMFGVLEQYLPANRLVRVLASFGAIARVSSNELGFQDVRAHTDALAIAPYFGVRQPQQAGVVGMTVDQLIAFLQNTSLVEIQAQIQAQAAVAAQYNVPLVAYEGGQSLLTFPPLQNDAGLNALYDATNRDPRMGNVYDQYLQIWSAAGGQLFNHFDNCEGYGVFGRWGSLEYITQPRASAPKYDALQRWIEGSGGANNPLPPAPAPPAITSPAPGATLTSASQTFTWTADSAASHYWLYVGSTAGGHDLLNQDEGASLSATVNGLPTDGRSLYVRLWYLTSTWQSVDSTYTAATIVSAPPAMSSPAAGSTLTSSSVTFTWSAGGGASRYWMWIGSTAGTYDLYNQDQGANLSATVNGLPTDGRSLYVRLWYLSGTWQFVDVTFTAATIVSTPPAMGSPAAGSTLTSSSVTFTWSAGSGTSHYWIWIGSTAGGRDLFNQDEGASLSATVNGLPTDGRSLYVRLWYLTATWQFVDVTYTAATLASAPPAMTSPAPGSTLTSSSVTFTWSAGTGTSHYWIWIGSTAAGHDLFNQDMGASLSATVNGLPTDGRTVYVRLWYLSGTWQFVDVTYQAQ